MSGCLPFCSGDFDGSDGCDVLVVGMEGSGKTLLCRRLQGLHAPEPQASHFNAYTVTTSGIQLTEVPCPKGTHGKSILMREVGGQMSPLWPQYLEDCRMVLFVVDASDAANVAPSAVELCELLGHPAMLRKPLCVVLTKQDQALVLSRQEIEMVMHLSALERCVDHGCFSVLEASAIPGAFSVADASGREVDSAQRLLEWMIDAKARAAGVPIPRAGGGAGGGAGPGSAGEHVWAGGLAVQRAGAV